MLEIIKDIIQDNIVKLYIPETLPKIKQNRKLLDVILQKLKDKNYNNVNCLADEEIGFYEHIKASIYLKVNGLLIYLPKKLKKGSDKFIID